MGDFGSHYFGVRVSIKVLRKKLNWLWFALTPVPGTECGINQSSITSEEWKDGQMRHFYEKWKFIVCMLLSYPKCSVFYSFMIMQIKEYSKTEGKDVLLIFQQHDL